MAKKITKAIKNEVQETAQEVKGAFMEGWNAAKAEAEEDVATFTIDRWHVVVAAVIAAAALFVIVI